MIHVRRFRPLITILGGLTLMMTSCATQRFYYPIPDFTRLYDETKNHIVVIQVYTERKAPPQRIVLISSGAGAIVNSTEISSGQYEIEVVTTHHIIENGEHIFVSLYDGRRRKARLIGSNKMRDLALLRFDEEGYLDPAVFGDSRKIRIGEWVYAIGHPDGLRWTYNFGTISNLFTNNLIPSILFDSSIWHGSSGGGLFDANKKLIGIPHMRAGTRSGVAIPSHVVEAELPSMRSGKTARTGWLGVDGIYVDHVEYMLPRTNEKGSRMVPGAEGGFYITRVMPNSPGAKAGLQISDIITEINGVPITDDLYFQYLVSGNPPGTKISISAVRGQTPISLTATLGEIPKE